MPSKSNPSGSNTRGWSQWRTALQWEEPLWQTDAEKAKLEYPYAKKAQDGATPPETSELIRASWRVPTYLQRALQRHLYPDWAAALEEHPHVDVRAFSVKRTQLSEAGIPLDPHLLREIREKKTKEQFRKDAGATEGETESLYLTGDGSPRRRPPLLQEVMQALLGAYTKAFRLDLGGRLRGTRFERFLGELRWDLPFSRDLSRGGAQELAEEAYGSEATEGKREELQALLEPRTTTFSCPRLLKREFKTAASHYGYKLSTVYAAVVATWLTSEGVDPLEDLPAGLGK